MATSSASGGTGPHWPEDPELVAPEPPRGAPRPTPSPEPPPGPPPEIEEVPGARREDGPAFEPEPEAPPELGTTGRRGRSLKAWVRQRAERVVTRLYQSQADDLEQRARRVVGSAYRDSADDLEERAVRAMRRAIAEEAGTIKEVIEHAVRVKKQEVRLSLLVLVVASLIYLVLFWATHSGAPDA